MAEPDKQEGAGSAAGWGPTDEAGAPGPGQAPWPPAPDFPGVGAPGVGAPGAGVPGVGAPGAGVGTPGAGEPLPSALAPPPPPLLTVEPPPARSSSLKPLLAICALSVVSASLCAGVILYMRQDSAPASEPAAQGEDKPSSLPGEPMPPVITTAAPGAAPGPDGAASPTPGKAVRAVVTLPSGQPRAVLRNKPDFEGDMVVFLPPGTAVEITNSTTAAGGTWFRVKTIDFQPPASGWVHGAILKMQ